MEDSLAAFKQSILKSASNKGMKVRNSWGVYDIFKHIRKNGWYNIGRPVTEKEFYAIIRGVNKRLAENLSNGESIDLPNRMGILELRKYEHGVSIVGGKVKNTYPVDWPETLKLWFEDEEARKNKTLLRNEQKFVYHVRYNKYKANYENKTFYQFTLNRLIKKALKENIERGKIETLW